MIKFSSIKKTDTLSGHKDCIYALEQYENLLYSSGGDGMVVVWDLNNPEIGKLIAQVPASVYALKYLSQTHQLLIGQNFDGLQLLDLQNSTILKSLKITEKAIFDIQISNNTIWVACGNGEVILVDLEAFQVSKKIQYTHKSARCIALHPNGLDIAIGFSDFSIAVFDAHTFSLKKQWKAHENSVFALAYTHTGDFLLSGGRDAHLKIWESTHYSFSQDIPAHFFTLNHIAFSPNGTYFATCSMDKSIKIWQTEGFKLLKVIDKARNAGHATSVNKVLWTDTQNLLVSASDDRQISLWSFE